MLFNFTAIDAAGGTGFRRNDLVQLRKCRLEMLPNPPSEVFACRILQSLNLVEVVVVKPVEQRFEGGLDVREIHDPAKMFIHWGINKNGYLERMTVEPSALVSFRHIGEPVSSFKRELFIYFQGAFLSVFKVDQEPCESGYSASTADASRSNRSPALYSASVRDHPLAADKTAQTPSGLDRADQLPPGGRPA